MRTALEGMLVATTNMLFFVLWVAWILAYLNISEAAFKIAGGIILFLWWWICWQPNIDPQTCCKQDNARLTEIPLSRLTVTMPVQMTVKALMTI